jgi:hypothetical protein
VTPVHQARGEYVTVSHHGSHHVARPVTPALSGEYVTEAILARFARPRPPVPVIHIEGPPPKPRGKRKPSIATLIARAEKAGKAVTSVTTPDGTVLHFGEPQPSEANNPWLADLHKVTKQ